MTKKLAEAQTKLQTVGHQLETAKVEVEKPFAQETELAGKLADAAEEMRVHRLALRISRLQFAICVIQMMLWPEMRKKSLYSV